MPRTVADHESTKADPTNCERETPLDENMAPSTCHPILDKRT